jgi:hypothetical protein
VIVAFFMFEVWDPILSGKFNKCSFLSVILFCMFDNNTDDILYVGPFGWCIHFFPHFADLHGFLYLFVECMGSFFCADAPCKMCESVGACMDGTRLFLFNFVFPITTQHIECNFYRQWFIFSAYKSNGNGNKVSDCEESSFFLFLSTHIKYIGNSLLPRKLGAAFCDC